MQVYIYQQGYYKTKQVVLGGLFLLLLLNSKATIRLPKLISDGMVLQRNTTVAIWGWADVGEAIKVSFNNKIYQTVTNTDGKWQIPLKPTQAGGPYSITISGSNTITINNVLFGDVWICSGQSNMELPIDRVKDNYPNLVANSTNDFIRQFGLDTRHNFTEQQQDVATGSWQSANPKTVLQFTAVGYFFAKSLYEKYHVPIGLIKSCVGGSPAEAWLCEDSLKKYPHYLAQLQKFKNPAFVDSIKQADNATNTNWYNYIFTNDKGLHSSPKWYDNTVDTHDWQTFTLPGYWSQQSIASTNGVIWFRKTIVLPDSLAAKQATLSLGTIVDRDSVFVNGKFIGTTGYQYPPRKYTIPAGILQAGKNIITIRVINYGGSGGFTLDKKYALLVGNTSINLSGTWLCKLGTQAAPIGATTTLHYQPASLYNAMIAPLLNYSIKGVIWYQGESNTGKAKEYKTLFPDVINCWRKAFKQDELPFLFVQLANFMEAKNTPSESNWAELREAQLQTLQLKNTGMAVTIDIGEWNDIHPLNKADVGKRLALAAEKVAYKNKHITYSGPLYKSVVFKNGKAYLNFLDVENGFKEIGKTGLQQFSIAGADKKFVWANATIVGKQIVVWADAITAPVAVRYAWANNPAGANLYNKEGLPASPFRTDSQE